MDRDGSLHDEQLQGEIELVGELVLAASTADGPLSEEHIDTILGVRPPSADETAAVDEAG